MIHVLDLHFLDTPQAIAAFVIETSEGPVLVETGPYSTFKHLQQGLQAKGFSVSDIRHVLLTHIHFDHAGAAWALAAQGAKIYVHPVGAKHMANPEKLVASAQRIYKEDMDRLWGAMEPVAESQLVAVKHEEELTIGNTTIKAWHTPGHAVHHIAWQVSAVHTDAVYTGAMHMGDVLFTGDVAGVRINQGLVEPPCPPPDINVEAWQQSIKLIREINPQTMYLTHFGPVQDIEMHLDELEKNLLDWADWIRMKLDQHETQEEIEPEFKRYVANELKASGANDTLIRQYEAANPSGMSVAGLMRYWKKRGSL